MSGLARPGVPDHSVTYRSALRSSISLPASQLSCDHLATALADGLREIASRRASTSLTSMRMRWNPIQARVSRSLSHS
jgi:hypothetical protein